MAEAVDRISEVRCPSQFCAVHEVKSQVEGKLQAPPVRLERLNRQTVGLVKLVGPTRSWRGAP
jgi:hypothetical protein